MLPKEAIEEYQKLHNEHYGTSIPFEEAAVCANALINLYRAVCMDK